MTSAGRRADAVAAAHRPRARTKLAARCRGLADARGGPATADRARGVLPCCVQPLVAPLPGSPLPRLADLERLASAAAAAPDLAAFVADLTLDPPRHTGDLAGRRTWTTTT